MSIKFVFPVLLTAIAVTALCTGAFAEKTVYKWVDEDGVVHFTDARPANSSPVQVETLTIPKSPVNVSPTQPVAMSPAVSSNANNSPFSPQAAEAPLLFETIDITKMSIADLDLRCEEAREKMIAPLREAEISNCKEGKKNDPGWCERFNADYGEGGRNINGSMRPRMFDDLPECVEALQEKNRRGR